MFRMTDMVLVGVMVSAAAFTYVTKHGAEAEYGKLRKLEAAIRFEEESIDVLKADWSLLTQPGRLQRLTDVYHEELKLVPLEAHQIAEIDDLPMRPVQIEDLLNGEPAGIADASVDDVTTGGVVR